MIASAAVVHHDLYPASSSEIAAGITLALVIFCFSVLIVVAANRRRDRYAAEARAHADQQKLATPVLESEQRCDSEAPAFTLSDAPDLPNLQRQRDTAQTVS